MAKDVIIALDFPTREETLRFLDRFPAGEDKPFVKIGMELYYAGGPSIVREIKARGHKIFLDLKLHDIPNTVKRAMAVLSGLDVDMVNLHAAGASAMMKAALEGLTRPELLIETPMAETVLSYAKNAAASGLDGVVCSPLEAALVKERCGESFCTVTPGVRFAGGDAGDQKRVMTPEQAAKNGCDYIVMGRPITQAADPVAAYRRAVKEFLG